MAETFKKLGELLPSANALQALYTVPVSGSAVISSLVICNQSNQTALVRVSHAISGASDDRSQYQYYDQPIPPKQTFIATIGMTASSGDIIRVRSSNAETSFSAYGSELS